MKCLSLARLYLREAESIVLDYVDSVGVIAFALQVFLLIIILLAVVLS